MERRLPNLKGMPSAHLRIWTDLSGAVDLLPDPAPIHNWSMLVLPRRYSNLLASVDACALGAAIQAAVKAWRGVFSVEPALNVLIRSGEDVGHVFAELVPRTLRPSEVAALTLGHIQQRDNRWRIIDLVGKHGRVRTIPMPTWVKGAIDVWTSAADFREGPVLRRVNRGDQVQGNGISEKVVWQLLQQLCGRCRRSGHRSSRLEAREIVPRGECGAGADPIVARARKRADHRTGLGQEAGSGELAE